MRIGTRIKVGENSTIIVPDNTMGVDGKSMWTDEGYLYRRFELLCGDEITIIDRLKSKLIKFN